MADPAAATDLWSKIVGFIREFGLPTFLVIWFLFRIEKKLERFTKALHRLLTINIIMLKTLDKDDEADKLLADGDEDPGLLKELKKETDEEDAHQKKKTHRKLKTVKEDDDGRGPT